MLETSDAIIARPNYEESRYGTNLMLIMPPKKCSLGDIDSPCTVCFVTNKSRSSWSSLNWSNFSMHYSSHTHSDHLPFLGSFKLFLVSRTMFAAIIPLVLSLINTLAISNIYKTIFLYILLVAIYSLRLSPISIEHSVIKTDSPSLRVRILL